MCYDIQQSIPWLQNIMFLYCIHTLIEAIFIDFFVLFYVPTNFLVVYLKMYLPLCVAKRFNDLFFFLYYSLPVVGNFVRPDG